VRACVGVCVRACAGCSWAKKIHVHAREETREVVVVVRVGGTGINLFFSLIFIIEIGNNNNDEVPKSTLNEKKLK
jgi:hypothetical protein